MLTNEQFENLYKLIKSNATVPNWFVYNYKTVQSRNITVEDWNRLYEYFKRILTDIDGYDKLIQAIYEQSLEIAGDLLIEIANRVAKDEELQQSINTLTFNVNQRIDEVVLTFNDYVPKDLSELPSVSTELDNSKLTFYADAEGTPSRLDVEGLRKRIIKTVETETTDIQTNQYVFEKI